MKRYLLDLPLFIFGLIFKITLRIYTSFKNMISYCFINTHGFLCMIFWRIICWSTRELGANILKDNLIDQ